MRKERAPARKEPWQECEVCWADRESQASADRFQWASDQEVEQWYRTYHASGHGEGKPDIGHRTLESLMSVYGRPGDTGRLATDEIPDHVVTDTSGPAQLHCTLECSCGLRVSAEFKPVAERKLAEKHRSDRPRGQLPPEMKGDDTDA